ncbi:MAG: RNA polymerase sigma factor [Anaerolineae bacterium]
MDAEQQRALVIAIRQGDKAALQTLYQECLPLIKARTSYAAGKVRLFAPPWYDVDDLFQDAFLVFLDLVQSYDIDSEVPFHGYLSSCLKQRLISWLQKKRAGQTMGRHRFTELPIDDLSLDTPGDDDLHDPSGLSSSVRSHWNDLKSHPALTTDPPSIDDALAHSLLEALPSDRHRTIVAMFIMGYSHVETARHLGCAKETVCRQYRRCLAYMRAIAQGQKPPPLKAAHSYRDKGAGNMPELQRLIDLSFADFDGRLLPLRQAPRYGFSQAFWNFARDTLQALDLIAKGEAPNASWHFTAARHRVICSLKRSVGP